MDPGPPRRRRARPVADAPVDALLGRSEDLTKGWLLALLEQAPLDEAPGILAAELARDGPRVCDAVVRALASDADLRRLAPGGALELLVAQAGDIAGARGVASASRAVDALGAVIWSGVRSELSQPDPEQIAELAERLAVVVELVREAALRHCAGETPGLSAAGSPAPARDIPPVPARDQPRSAAAPASSSPQPGAEGGGPVREGNGVEAGAEGVSAPSRLSLDTLWVRAVDDEILRSERTGAPLSLLLIELEEADRMLAVGSPVEARATLGRFAQAVRSAVRRHDILACETDTRAWVIARDTGRLGAQALGARIAGAVRAAEPWRGAPLTVSVGLSVLGDDGLDQASLIEAAEESRFAAAAGGLEVHGMRPDDEGSGPPLPG